MGSRTSRNYSASYPRIRSLDRSDAAITSNNNNAALLNGYHTNANDFHRQSRFHMNGPHHLAGNATPATNMVGVPSTSGSTRIPYINRSKGAESVNDMGFRNNFFEASDITHLRMSKRIPPSKSTLLQELLECPICMNLYENPHVLPCQHTFCKKCLILMQNNEANTKTTLDCPICREVNAIYNLLLTQTKFKNGTRCDNTGKSVTSFPENSKNTHDNYK